MATVITKYERTRQKVRDLLAFFDTIEVSDNEEVQLDVATRVTDVKKFINFSREMLKNFDVLTRINKPYITRLHRLREYYEQEQKATGQTRKVRTEARKRM